MTDRGLAASERKAERERAVGKGRLRKWKAEVIEQMQKLIRNCPRRRVF